MTTDGLTNAQIEVITAPLSAKLFLEGPPGSGKTTAAVRRLAFLMENGVPAEQILVLAPQRTLAIPYVDSLHRPDYPDGGLASTITIGGLAQRMVQLFWPAIAGEAGFSHPELPPVFLTLETAQYFMAQVVRPLLDEGYFEQVTIDRNRLFAQVLDNLNKAAVAGFSHLELAERLKNAWVGRPAQLILYDQVQECANRFRDFCLQNNLLDFSLQIEVFANLLWPSDLVRSYLRRQYRHLIYDNVEEDVPVAHDVIREWLPALDSALLVYDSGGGNRVFLGADPDYGYALREECPDQLVFQVSLNMSPAMNQFQDTLAKGLGHRLEENLPAGIETAFSYSGLRFFTEMVDQVSGEIVHLIKDEQIPPAEIAVLTPYLSDALRHALTHRLAQSEVQIRSIRPSRSLHDEPAARCLITLAYLAHPRWEVLPTKAEFRSMILQVIQGIDLVRAELITAVLYRYRNVEDPLGDFDPVIADIRERITFSVGEHYNRLRAWLLDYRSAEQPVELDVFLSRLFGEVISQPGFGFHDNFEAAGVTARLIELIQKFRRVAENTLSSSSSDLGEIYLRMVREGVIASQYLQPYQEETDAVLIAPAFTFIMANRPVSYQFWLDIGAQAWWERLYQPLTHPYVLSRRWPIDKVWTDADEYEANQQTLVRLTGGLLARCRTHVYLYSNRINERGAEERGALLQAMNIILHRLFIAESAGHV